MYISSLNILLYSPDNMSMGEEVLIEAMGLFLSVPSKSNSRMIVQVSQDASEHNIEVYHRKKMAVSLNVYKI